MDILAKLMGSQKLCKLLYYNSNHPLSEPDIEDTSQLLFKNIYPIPHLPGTSTEMESFLTVRFDDIRLGTKNSGFKNIVLCMNVLCHKDKWWMDGALRPYAILNKIDEIFNNQKVVGIGKVQFDQGRFFIANHDYFGYRVKYIIKDFS